MKKNSAHRQTPRSTEQVSRDKELRSRFQSERPTLESLVDSGEYHAPITQQEYFGLMQFVAHLKKCREEQNLSLADVAKLSGIDKAALSRIENGLAENPTVLTLERIAHSIGKCLRLSLEDSCWWPDALGIATPKGQGATVPQQTPAKSPLASFRRS